MPLFHDAKIRKEIDEVYFADGILNLNELCTIGLGKAPLAVIGDTIW